ncbi:MAG: putative DNA modification/repair radical SAM protein [Oscillospiraceae bacterium]|nr:putative DNA modification/repair radical SAM protein [Oscillospiraceae bacterium]
MDIKEKLTILAAAARYDVSCASSGSTRKGTADGIGNAASSGICHSWTSDGRCVSLLKILMTNVCIYDCKYCCSRSSNDVRRAAFEPEEIADLTISFYKRNYIEGLFLSSAVIASPNRTMELMAHALALLREKHKFNGYIHAKVIPNTDPALMAKVGFLADRVSCNIELPSNESLTALAPQKSKDAILGSMRWIHDGIRQGLDVYRPKGRQSLFVPAGQSTQMVVGATKDTDYQIVRLAESLYGKYRLRRVYYSAYIPASPKVSLAVRPPLVREHRLYQADWLLRFYRFSASEILSEKHPFLFEEIDPKTGWALRNIGRFPIEVNKAGYYDLLRVPGIGQVTAGRIMEARKHSTLAVEDLKRIGVVLKRARHFILCDGKYHGLGEPDPMRIYRLLAGDVRGGNPFAPTAQLELPAVSALVSLPMDELRSLVTGEL